MAKNSTYHPDDPDLRLARYIDRDTGRDTDMEISSADESMDWQPADDQISRKDPLLQLMADYKSRSELRINAETTPRVKENVMHQVELDIFADRQNSQSVRTSLHDGVEKSINDVNKHPRVLPLWKRSSVLWRVAAILITVSFLGLYLLLTDSDQPELLAESGDSKIEWTLNDGSRIVLRPHSDLYQISENDESQHYFIDGEAYFDVQKNDDRKFIVQTGEAIVEVTGTRFTLRSWDSMTLVFLEEGSIVFSNNDRSGEVLMSPGQASMVRNGRITEPLETSPEIYLGWLNDELILDSRRLEDVIGEISHHFDITINLEPSLHNEELSGTIQLDDPDKILDDLALSLGADIKKITAGHYQIVAADSK